ncbi:hypothetical protein SAMN02927923_00429 [Microvirga guangxiensis]|uniref:Uncharacterized protein n=1 Tax=Microvirga guangxiensis TaxID=549386 RepID=A0A1G5C372_9HYPH|nr:hypothetical protein SAMN02927923_00429 [Microvirga guangxiensis]
MQRRLQPFKERSTCLIQRSLSGKLLFRSDVFRSLELETRQIDFLPLKVTDQTRFLRGDCFAGFVVAFKPHAFELRIANAWPFKDIDGCLLGHAST